MRVLVGVTLPRPIDITQEELHRLFELRDGNLYWKVKVKTKGPGDLAGGVNKKNPYWRIKIRGRSYKRSRLMWIYVHGEDSYPNFVDHINRDPTDDRIENLRLVTHSENQRNRSWGASKKRYVYHENNKWRARPTVSNGKRIHLGSFETEAEAILAVKQWEEGNG